MPYIDKDSYRTIFARIEGLRERAETMRGQIMDLTLGVTERTFRIAELENLLAGARVYVSMCSVPENRSCNDPQAASDLLDDIDRACPGPNDQPEFFNAFPEE